MDVKVIEDRDGGKEDEPRDGLEVEIQGVESAIALPEPMRTDGNEDRISGTAAIMTVLEVD